MRRVFLVVVISALAWARPETYKETEDFQYSRSSSDEGSKSGFYGAQRGNVGGNYERAHNMDSLAQHQMSGAVHQVEGELGDATKNRAGSVYTAANSRGVYGSGHFDLSNLQGRNFGESGSVDSSHSSLSSAYNQHSQNSDWRSHSQQSSGFGASDNFGQSSLHSGSLHSADIASVANNHRSSNLENQYGYNSGFHSRSGYQSQSGYQGETASAYDQRMSNSHLSSGYGAQTGEQTQSRYIVPVRIYGRPGTQVAVPVFAQSYDTHRAAAFDQNAINSEAEVLNNNQHQTSSIPQGKHYESSYSYQKAWERRSDSTSSNVPTVAPTVNPFPRNSELYDESQAQVASGSDSLQQANSHDFRSGQAYNAQSSYANSGSAQSRHQLGYSSQHKSQSDLNSNAYTLGTHGSLAGPSLVANVDSTPKSYQSSYSYHKSWERQGDPYVIVPETHGGTVAANTKTGALSSQHHSSQYRQSNHHNSQGSAYVSDCDEYGHVRSRRSYNNHEYQEELGQQAQRGWDNLGQQAQSGWDDLGQQIQQPWGNLQQQNKPEKLEDLGQQTQQLWGDFQKENQPEQLEALGQQTQQSWVDLQQQNKPEKLEDLGQQTQQYLGNFQPEKTADLGQQTQELWHGSDQQAENGLSQQKWDQSNIGQHVSSQNLEEFGHHDNQQSQQTFDDLETLGQQTQSKWDNLDTLGQQTQHVWDKSENTDQQSKPESIEDLGQQTQNKWDNIENLGQQVQTQWDDTSDINKTRHIDTLNTEQQTQTQFQSGDQKNQEKEKTEDTWNTQHAMGNTDFVRNSENTYLNNPIYPTFWDVSKDKSQHNFYGQQHSYNSFNSHSQRDGASWQEQILHNNVQSTSINPLQSLWDKIDNLEEQNIPSFNDKQQSSDGFMTGYENAQHSYYAHGSTYHHESNSEQTSNSFNHNQYQTHYIGSRPTFVFNKTQSIGDESKNEENHSEGIPKKPEDKEYSDKLQPTDVGRGDISAEEESTIDVSTPTNERIHETYSTHIKPEKTPEEIEALSLSRGTNENKTGTINQADALSVLSISQQQWLEDQRLRASNDFHKFSISSTTGRPDKNENSKSNRDPELIIHEHNSDSSQDVISSEHNKNMHEEFVETPEEINQQNTEQHYEGFHHQTSKPKHNDSQNVNKNSFGHDLTDFGQQHTTGQELEDFGQQTQDLSQQNIQQFETGQHSHQLDQQNTGQQLEHFGQQTQDLNQQNIRQELEDFGQQSQDFSQQNQQQYENLEHQRTNTGQQLVDFGQQIQDFNQRSQNQNTRQQLEDFGAALTNQQNTRPELEDFGQQSQDLGQQNLQQFENLEHPSQNTGQQLEDFGQESQDLSQQNLQSFVDSGHHSQHFDRQNSGQQLEDFGQQNEDLNQQSQDLTQQSLQQFENLGQQSQNLDQQRTWEAIDDLKPVTQNKDTLGKYSPQAREFEPKSKDQEIQEPKIAAIEIPESQSVPKQEVEKPPPETTEKPGFWNSVGSKLSSAKDSVASWFKRS